MTPKRREVKNLLWLASPLFLVALLLAWRGASEVGAQSTTSESTETLLEEKINTFFKELQESRTTGPKTAMENLFRDGARGMRAGSETIDTLSRTYTEMREAVGEMRSTEVIKRQKVGGDIMLFQCVAKHENAPVLWYFTFYQSPRTGESGVAGGPSGNYWNINHVRFDTNLEPLFLTTPATP